MNHIAERILYENPNAVFVFDVDGVLASYEYDVYNHRFPSYVWENLIEKGTHINMRDLSKLCRNLF